MDGLGRDGQAHQKTGFPIAEESGVTNDQIAEDQKDEQKNKEQEKEPFGQERAEGGEVIEEPQAAVKQFERHAQVNHHKQPDGESHGGRGRVDGFEPPPALQGVDPDQQPQGPGGFGAVLRHGGIFKQAGVLARQIGMTDVKARMAQEQAFRSNTYGQSGGDMSIMAHYEISTSD